jgi:hypothetical protein
MTNGILKSKELHTSQTTISVSAGTEIYATTLVDAKLSRRLYLHLWSPKQINKKHLEGLS